MDIPADVGTYLANSTMVKYLGSSILGVAMVREFISDHNLTSTTYLCELVCTVMTRLHVTMLISDASTLSFVMHELNHTRIDCMTACDGYCVQDECQDWDRSEFER